MAQSSGAGVAVGFFRGLIPKSTGSAFCCELSRSRTTWPVRVACSDSVQWGQAGFYKMGVHGFLNKYEEEFGDYELFITGGDASVIDSMLERESKVRAVYPVLEGNQKGWCEAQMESKK
ncbi:MAG: hypothetical protein U5K71_12285 [Gracilimonas sp.]|nr:hypothetical protein [Gracilimonas sp.]